LLLVTPTRAQEGTGRSEELDSVLAAALDEQGSEADLLKAYGELLAAWAEDSEVLGGEPFVLTTVERIHARRQEAGFQQRPFVMADWVRHAFDLKVDLRYEDARQFLETALPTYTEPSPYLVGLWLDLSDCCRQLDDQDAGSAALARAEELLGQIDPTALDDRGLDQLDTARFLVSATRALELTRRGLLDLAAPHVQSSLQIARRYRDERGKTWMLLEALFVRAAHDLALDRFEEILDWMHGDEVRDLVQGESDPAVRRLLVREGQARVYLERRDPDRPREARDFLLSLEEAMTDEDLVEERVRLVRWMAVSAIDEGRLSEARAHLDRAEELAGWNEDAPTPEQAVLAGLRARLTLLETKERLAAELQTARRAFDASIERWAGRAVLETGQGFQLFDEVRELVSEYVALLLAVEGAEGPELALRELLRAQEVRSLARSLGAGPASLEAVRRELAHPGEGFLLVLPGWTRSFAFVIGPEEVEVVELPSRNVLDMSRRALTRAAEGFVIRGSAELAELEAARRAAGEAFLPEALRAQLAGFDALTLVEVDSMGFVPFELLPWDEQVAVGERFAVSYLPSFPVGLALARRRGAGPLPKAKQVSTGLVVALPEHGKEGQLTFGTVERRMLLGEWPFDEVQPLVGPEATLAALSSERLSEATLLAIVAHGKRDPTSPRPQGLDLTDGVLTPAGAERLRVPGLVILVACQSWRGPLRSGDDGRDHLLGALFLAGADTEIASYTRIDYHAGLELTRRTLAALAEGLSPAGALRRARIAAARSSPKERWNAALIHAVGLAQDPLVQ
jgi:tetratricopeptide (TPR) repeat protein